MTEPKSDKKRSLTDRDMSEDRQKLLKKKKKTTSTQGENQSLHNDNAGGKQTAKKPGKKNKSKKRRKKRNETAFLLKLTLDKNLNSQVTRITQALKEWEKNELTIRNCKSLKVAIFELLKNENLIRQEKRLLFGLKTQCDKVIQAQIVSKVNSESSPVRENTYSEFLSQLTNEPTPGAKRKTRDSSKNKENKQELKKSKSKKNQQENITKSSTNQRETLLPHEEYWSPNTTKISKKKKNKIKTKVCCFRGTLQLGLPNEPSPIQISSDESDYSDNDHSNISSSVDGNKLTNELSNQVNQTPNTMSSDIESKCSGSSGVKEQKKQTLTDTEMDECINTLQPQVSNYQRLVEIKSEKVDSFYNDHLNVGYPINRQEVTSDLNNQMKLPINQPISKSVSDTEYRSRESSEVNSKNTQSKGIAPTVDASRDTLQLLSVNDPTSVRIKSENSQSLYNVPLNVVSSIERPEVTRYLNIQVELPSQPNITKSLLNEAYKPQASQEVKIESIQSKAKVDSRGTLHLQIPYIPPPIQIKSEKFESYKNLVNVDSRVAGQEVTRYLNNQIQLPIKQTNNKSVSDAEYKSQESLGMERQNIQPKTVVSKVHASRNRQLFNDPTLTTIKTEKIDSLYNDIVNRGPLKDTQAITNELNNQMQLPIDQVINRSLTGTEYSSQSRQDSISELNMEMSLPIDHTNNKLLTHEEYLPINSTEKKRKKKESKMEDTKLKKASSSSTALEDMALPIDQHEITSELNNEMQLPIDPAHTNPLSYEEYLPRHSSEKKKKKKESKMKDIKLKKDSSSSAALENMDLSIDQQELTRELNDKMQLPIDPANNTLSDEEYLSKKSSKSKRKKKQSKLKGEDSSCSDLLNISPSMDSSNSNEVVPNKSIYRILKKLKCTEAAEMQETIKLIDAHINTREGKLLKKLLKRINTANEEDLT